MATFNVALSKTTNISSGKKEGKGGKDALDRSKRPKIKTIQWSFTSGPIKLPSRELIE